MARKSKYTQVCEHINAHREERSRAFTRFLENFDHEALATQGNYGVYNDTPSKYPISDMLMKSVVDRVHTRRALKNLEAKGNQGARELLEADNKGVDKVFSVDDLTLIFDEALVNLEKSGYLGVEEAEDGFLSIVSTNEDVTGPILPKLYGIVTKALYEQKTRNSLVHCSYEVETNDGTVEFINIKDRKALAKYVDKEDVLESADFKRFIKSIKKDTRKDALNDRLSVLYCLLDGLTYAQIADQYLLKVSTVGAHVTALRSIYKETFAKHKPNKHGMAVYGDIVARLCIHRADLISVSVGSPIQAHFPQLEFGGVYYDFNSKTRKLSVGGNRSRVSYDMLSNDALLTKVEARESAVAVETSMVSKIKPSKKKFESAEFLYKCRHLHCLNPRNAVLAEETKLRALIELENKRLPENGELVFRTVDGKIQVFYGETLKSEYPIVKLG